MSPVTVLLWLLCSAIEQVQPFEPRTAIAVKCKVKKPRAVHRDSYSFQEMVLKSDVFVDRSLLIRDALTCNKKILFITTPPKFGKSVNLDMIRTFVNFHVDRDGEQLIDTQDTFSYQLFKFGKIRTSNSSYVKLEQPLLISKCIDMFLKFHGQYPVIYVNFTDLAGNTYNEIVASMKQRIGDTYRQHGYLLSVLKRDQSEEGKKELAKFRDYLYMAENVDELFLESSVKFLCTLLSRTYNKCPFIMIDELDATVELMLRNGFYSSDDQRCIIKLFESFMKRTFRENINYKQGIMTGSYSFTRKFFDMYKLSLIRYTALYNAYYQYFGYCPQHVEALFSHADVDPLLSFEAYDWYKGYALGINETSSLSNPYSILCFIRSGKMESYWERATKQNVNLRNLFNLKQILQTFQTIVHEQLTVDLNHLNTSKMDITRLSKLLNEKDDCALGDQLYKLILLYLVDIGYITFGGFKYVGDARRYHTHLRLPNKEIQQHVRLQLRWHYIRKYKIPAKYADKTSAELARMIRADDADPTVLAELMQTLFEDLQIFVFADDTSNLTYPVDYEIADSVLHFLALNMRYIQHYQVKVNQAGCNMTLYADRKAAIVQFGFQAESLDDLMRVAKSYRDVFNLTQYPIKTIKFFAVNVLFEKKVDVKVDEEIL